MYQNIYIGFTSFQFPFLMFSQVWKLMSRLAAPAFRLPLRIQSLVSLTSLLVRIQPISSLHPPTTRPPLTSPTQGGGTKGVQSTRGPIRAGESSNCPISGGRYMCGNSLSSMASSNAAVIQPSGTHTATVSEVLILKTFVLHVFYLFILKYFSLNVLALVNPTEQGAVAGH